MVLAAVRAGAGLGNTALCEDPGGVPLQGPWALLPNHLQFCRALLASAQGPHRTLALPGLYPSTPRFI